MRPGKLKVMSVVSTSVWGTDVDTPCTDYQTSMHCNLLEVGGRGCGRGEGDNGLCVCARHM